MVMDETSLVTGRLRGFVDSRQRSEEGSKNRQRLHLVPADASIQSMKYLRIGVGESGLRIGGRCQERSGNHLIGGVTQQATLRPAHQDHAALIFKGNS